MDLATILPSLLGTAAALTGAELLKQVGIQATRRWAPPAVVAGLQVLDHLMPSLLAEGATGAELEARVRAQLGELTGTDWARIRRDCDPVIMLDKLAAERGQVEAWSRLQWNRMTAATLANRPAGPADPAPPASGSPNTGHSPTPRP